MTKFAALSLIEQFFLISLAVIGIGMSILGLWMSANIREGVIRNSADTTRIYLQSFVEPLIQELETADELSQQSQTSLLHILQDGPLKDRLLGLKVWRPDGTILFSNKPDAIGKKYEIEEGLTEALKGRTSPEFDELGSPENELDDFSEGPVLEIYAPLFGYNSGRVVGAGEFYLRTDVLVDYLYHKFWQTWAVVGGLGLAMVATLSMLMFRASDTIQGQRTSLEKQVNQLSALLDDNRELSERIARANQNAAELTDRYLGQIGSDLHDGPAQLLGLALMQMREGQANGFDRKRRKTDSTDVRGAVKAALREIRLIAAGLVLPELETFTTEEAVELAVSSHERFTGSLVKRAFELPVPDVPRPVKAAIYRVVQEGLNNAFKHAGSAGQMVAVRSNGADLVIEVGDRGNGFVWDGAKFANGHMGLAGLQNRIMTLGGTLGVEPRPGGGSLLIIHLPMTERDTADDKQDPNWHRGRPSVDA